MLACHGVSTAGAERTLVSLARAAAGRGDRVTFVVPRSGPVLDLLRAEVPTATVVRCRAQWWMGVDHHGLGGLLRLVQAAVHVLPWLALLRRGRPDRLVVGAGVTPAPLAAAHLLRIPVVSVLGESILTNPTLRSVLPKPVLVRLLRRWSDVTVGVSDFAAAQYGGTDLVEAPDVLPVGATPPAQPDAAPGVPAPGPRSLRVVMLGTLSSEKGQLDAVRALGRLPAGCQGVTLDLFGDARPDDLAELERLVGRLDLAGRVRHHGTSGRPEQVLRDADVSLVCSRNEAYGRVTAESLLAGTPVVGYALGATVEILGPGGGLLVEPSPAGVADALASLVGDPDRLTALREQARARSTDRSGFGRAEETFDRIHDLLARRTA